MKRAVKFKLKDGRVVTIRPLRADDYDAFAKFHKEFAKGPGAKWAWMYPERPMPEKEHMLKDWSNKNNLFIGVFDENKIVGYAQIRKLMVGHPFSARNAMTATSILEKYTSNGLGAKIMLIIEKWAYENGVHKLEAETFLKNTRSIGNLLKSGYEIVGISHDAAFIDGEWHHEYILEKILEK